ncbi:MAG: hypothetical protein CMI57_00475, partial [Parcubacteria group bacterium]|nr:hypothetical protein [Parcubacteria group bacterium]
FETLKKVFKLNETEVEMVTFFYIKENVDIITNHFNNSSDIADFDQCLIIINQLFKIIGCKKSDIQKALSKGNLSKCGLVEKNTYKISLDDFLGEYISGISEKHLNEQFCALFSGESMTLDDLEISNEEKEMLTDLVSKKKRAVNILLYGEPGTGKTELAKSLAATTKKRIYIINNKDNEKASDFKRAIVATSNIADPDKSIILVDEADKLLNTRFSFFLSGEGNSKSWINTFLDENKHKIIWITNESTCIEPSTMRRFAFSMEFKQFNINKKVKAFQYQLQKYGLNNYFSNEELKTMSRRYSINAGGIADLIKNLGIRHNSNKQTTIKKINLVMRNHEIAITGVRSKKGKMKDMGEYSLNALNTSENLPSLVSTLKAFISRREDKRLKTLSNMNLLFYGQPGTGKTEFAKYLAQTLDKEILLKRASDLLSMWVGGTEKLIEEAFEEAEDNEAILFLDEADSFLYPRGEAIRSWEKTQTNELLTQMENFKGVMICATNFKKGLDYASLRRFKYKVEFKCLNPEGNFEMYKCILAPYVKKEMTELEINQMKSLKNLTPGEFHIVSEKLTLIMDWIFQTSFSKILDTLFCKQLVQGDPVNEKNI